MVLGLLPAIRGGLGELSKTGQGSRLIDGYFKPYARAFDEVRYFSYLRESLDRFTADAEVLARVRVLPGAAIHPWLYAFLMPVRYRRELCGCGILRVFQVTGVIPAVLAKRWFGVPFVTTYGFSYGQLARSRGSRWLRQRVASLGLAAADGVIVPTEALRAHVVARAGAAKVHLVPNGVDTARFRPAPRAAGALTRVLYVGRLSAEKNLDTLVEAVGKLVGRLDVRLTFVGDGPCRERLVGLARRLRVPLEARPFVDHRLLPAVFAEADVFVLPSFTEGHPKVLLEAMSSGLPCVASDVGGNRAILADGETGLLFDPGDPGGLAERLERVLGQEDFARGLGERARAEVVARYDLATLVAREIELLQRLARAR